MEAPRTLPEGVNFSYIFSFIGVTHSHFRALDLAPHNRWSSEFFLHAAKDWWCRWGQNYLQPCVTYNQEHCRQDTLLIPANQVFTMPVDGVRVGALTTKWNQTVVVVQGKSWAQRNRSRKNQNASIFFRLLRCLWFSENKVVGVESRTWVER